MGSFFGTLDKNSKNCLVSINELNKIDSQGMYKIYDKWPARAKESLELDFAADLKDIDHIVFAGMGGSGTIGDIFQAILSKTDIHVNVVKGYLLPKTVDSDTLVISTSFSGNTVETLNILESAKKLESKIISFSSGGKMEDYCTKNKIEYQKVPLIHSPRASLPAFLYTMLKVLNSVIPIKNEDVLDSINQLENLKKQIFSSNLTDENPSLELAEWISDIPIIYYPEGLHASATRFKNSFQENTKSHVMMENVIETCHNGIVSWETPSGIQPILIEGKDDYIKTKERWKILKEYFAKNNIDYKEVFSVEGGILSKLMNLIYLLDYTTIYRAILSGIDPSPIKSIDFIKNKL